MSTSWSSTRAGTRRAIGLGAYALAYAIALVVLAREPGASVVEPLFVLGVLGIAFPLLALLLTRATTATPDPIAQPRAEAGAALAWLAIFAIGVLGWGFSALRAAIAQGTAQELAILAAKLLAMVAIPVLILGSFGHHPRELLAPNLRWRAITLPLAGMGLALFGFQAVFGRGLTTLGELGPGAVTLAWAIPACLAWMALEAGLTEEFLFRRFLQERLSAWSGSDVLAVCVASLLFGLAHAPGLYLRGAHAMEGVAAQPSIAWAVAYSIAVISPAGLLFGTLWARTRSLGLVVLLHGLTDLLPNLAGFIRTWG